MRRLLLSAFLSLSVVGMAPQLRAADRAFGTVYLGNLKTGKTDLLSSYFGKGPVVLNFWATYCRPCRTEMPELQKALTKYPKVTLLFVNIDPSSKRALVSELARTWGLESTILLDVYQVAAKQYIPGLQVPATYLIDAAGNVTYRSVGYTDRTIPQLEQRLRTLP